MIIVTGSATTKPDTRARILEISKQHCARSRAEPGCISHHVHADCEDEDRLVFVEYWTDMAALMAHFQVKESRAFARELAELSATKPEMRLFEATERLPGGPR